MKVRITQKPQWNQPLTQSMKDKTSSIKMCLYNIATCGYRVLGKEAFFTSFSIQIKYEIFHEEYSLCNTLGMVTDLDTVQCYFMLVSASRDWPLH